MRRYGFIGIMAAVFALAAVGGGISALEIGAEERSGNIHFPWDQHVPTVGNFPVTNYFWGTAAWFSAPLGEDASLRVGYETDPVLRNVLSALVLFERGIARIQVGPFMGAFNSDTRPYSWGLSTTVRFQWPGLAFVSVRSDGGLAIGTLADVDANSPQILSELSAGFYVPNAIVTGTLTAKRFTETDAAGKLIIDAHTRYLLSVDVFKKNVPYNLVTSVGYQLRSKYFEASDVTEALGCLFLGLKAGLQVGPGVKLNTELTSGIFTFGLEGLENRSPAMNDFLFGASLGIVIDTTSLAKPVRKLRKPTTAAVPVPAPVPAPVSAPVSVPAETPPAVAPPAVTP